MDDDFDGVVGFIIIFVIIGLIVYAAIILASVIATVAGIGGTAWGGGTAVVNYCKSFKENMIDSNKVTV